MPDQQDDQSDDHKGADNGSGDDHGDDQSQGDQNQTTAAQKKHWRDKALAAEAENKALKERLEKVEQGTAQTHATVQDLNLASTHGLKPEEIKFLKTLASSEGKTPEECLENETFKSYIETNRSKSRAKEAIPEPSTGIPVVGDKPFGALPKAEQRVNYAGAVDSLVNKARKNNRSVS